MRRTNFRLPLSDVHYDFAAATSTAFDTLVIGGGVSGSMIAGKLLSERDKLLVIERGDNCLRPAKGYSDWVYSMPANMVVNRAINKQFVYRRPQNVSSDVLQHLFKDAQNSGFECTNISKPAAAAAAAAVDIQCPKVLGGSHVVLGGRSWFRGIQSDWDRDATKLPGKNNMPFDFDPRGIQLLRRLESIPPPEENRMKYFSGWSDAHPTLRGKKGTFRLSRPTQFSELFKPVLDGMVNVGCDLTTQWDPDQPPKTIGAGRINTVMTDHITAQGHSTLASYLSPSLEVQNSVLDDCTVESLIPGKDKQSVGGVRVRDNQSGDVKEIAAKRVILAAGADQSPGLLSSLADGISSKEFNPAKIGHMESMWTTPTVVLRYKINQPISLAPASNALVRALVVEEWRRFGTGWGCSAFDDMTCFYNVAPDLARSKFQRQQKQQQQQNTKSPSTGDDTTDSDLPKLTPYSPQVQDAFSNYGLTIGEPVWIRINTQPFILNGDGNFHSDHGFQLRISLCRPFSRGGLVSGGGAGDENKKASVIDYRPLSDERDVEALKAGIEFVTKAVFNGFPPDHGLMASPFDAELVFDGPHGGGNLVNEVVDESEFRVKGLDNCFVSDSSVHPHGQCADSHLFVMMATEAMHENALGRKLGSLD